MFLKHTCKDFLYLKLKAYVICSFRKKIHLPKAFYREISWKAFATSLNNLWAEVTSALVKWNKMSLLTEKFYSLLKVPYYLEQEKNRIVIFCPY